MSGDASETLGSWPPEPGAGPSPSPPPPGAVPAALPPPASGPSEDEAGWAAPPPVPGAGPSEDEAGWAAPPPPGGSPPPPAAGFQGASPAPAAAPVAGAGSSRRRRGAWVGLIAGLAITASRFFFAAQGDDARSTTNFALPQREEGRPVTATPLTGDEVCALVTTAELRAIYDRRFAAGEAFGDDAPTTGEPSDVPDVGSVAGCTWRARPGEPALTLTILSVPAIGGDANRTYELLRPSSLAAAFDTSEVIGDESFIYSPPFGQEGYSDSMGVRAGGVVLRLQVDAGEEPDGGVDLLTDVAVVAVDDLPTDP